MGDSKYTDMYIWKAWDQVSNDTIWLCFAFAGATRIVGDATPPIIDRAYSLLLSWVSDGLSNMERSMKSPAQIFARISSETRASSGREAEEQDWMRSCVSRGKGIWSTLPVAYNSATCGQGAAASLHAPASSCTTASGLKGCCTDVAAPWSIATGPIDAAICAALPNAAAEFEIGRSRAAGLCVVELSTTAAGRSSSTAACISCSIFSNAATRRSMLCSHADVGTATVCASTNNAWRAGESSKSSRTAHSGGGANGTVTAAVCARVCRTVDCRRAGRPRLAGGILKWAPQIQLPGIWCQSVTMISTITYNKKVFFFFFFYYYYNNNFFFFFFFFFFFLPLFIPEAYHTLD